MKKQIKIIISIIAIFSLITAYLSPINPQRKSGESAGNLADESTSNLSVRFLDVGQGNSILISLDDEYMLIDGGDRNHSSFVVSYLKKQGITDLKYVVVSHYDADHLSGIIGVINNFNIGTLIAPDYEADTKTYQSYRSALSTKKISPVHPARGDSYTLGSSAFTIVCPDSYDYFDENNNSVGLRLTYGMQSFLILGDASTESEYAMLDSSLTLKSTVYLVSHHGSIHSTSATFLDVVNPSYAVISVGENSYGHPTKEVLDRLEKKNISIYRTDLHGTIIFETDGNSLNISTKK
ncbi:MAG: MBL fold metallo-hydrolase [Clostridiales bacterium]|nr:MBL fold metallo-hydrolase [Clostridiales bacterium]